jgi:small subunit ribosomal protein S6
VRAIVSVVGVRVLRSVWVGGRLLRWGRPPLLPRGAADQRRWRSLRQYEIMVILDPEADEAAVNGVADRITGILSDHGGDVSSVDRWGRRKLAFEIERKSEGYYLVMAFTAESEALPELDRVLSLADEVIRFMVVRLAA